MTDNQITEGTEIGIQIGNVDLADDAMLATDDDLLDNPGGDDPNPEAQETLSEGEGEGEEVQLDADGNPIETPPAERNEGEEGEGGDDSTATELEKELDGLSQAALQVRLLAENGLDIYQDVDKELSFEQFAQDLPQYVNEVVEAQVEQRMNELGEYAKYAELMDKGVPQETLRPALEVQNIASFDIDGKDVTEKDLYDIVKKTELRRGNSDAKATILADAIKARGLDALKAEAKDGVDFHAKYIKDIQDRALQETQQQQAAQEQKIKQDHDVFVKSLQDSDLSKDDQKKLYDFQYTRDQLVNVKDQNGEDQKVYVTKWEIAMYNAQNDPATRLALLNFVASGFKMSDAALNKQKRDINALIISKLDSGKSSGTTRNVQTQKRVEFDEGVQSIGEFSVG